MKKVCEICENTFETNSKSRIYCYDFVYKIIKGKYNEKYIFYINIYWLVVI